MYTLGVIRNWTRNNLKKNGSIEKFIEVNRGLATGIHEQSINSKQIALLELHVSLISYIIYSLICRHKLSENIKIIGYNPLKSKKFKFNFTFYFFSRVRIDNGIFRPFRILNAIGITRFIQPTNTKKYRFLALGILEVVKQNDKKFLLDLKIEGIRIGDLFYDWHLRERLLDTVNVISLDFEKDFVFFISNFYWWLNYFNTEQVESVFVSHTVYQQAVPARIGLALGAEVYLVGNDRIYKLRQDRKWSDIEFLDYQPNSEIQFGYKIDLQRARDEINQLRSGQRITAAHVYASGFVGDSNEKIVDNRNHINILIACHCFSDAPHAYGDMLFEDFRVWLDFIGKLSESTDYNFFAKAHPYFSESDRFHYQNYLKEYPNIKEVPSTFSNLELFRQGINVVLTMHGTIAFEAAYEGILVINASLNSPHVNYNFSISPKSVEEYRDTILDLKNLILKWEINPFEVEHFFDLHHLRKNQNILFGENYREFYEGIGGFTEQFTNPRVYDFWLSDKNSGNSKRLEKVIRNFLNSDSYCLEQAEN